MSTRVPLFWLEGPALAPPENGPASALVEQFEEGDVYRAFRAPDGRRAGVALLRGDRVVDAVVTATGAARKGDEPLAAVPESDKGTRRYGHVAPRPPEGSIDLREVIPGEGAIEIDIGFGRGQSLFRRAQVAPDARLIGIEIKSKWSYLVEERRMREGLSKVRAWAGDAREILERCGPAGSVRRFYVHFPDPWWKRKHAHRMVVADRFLRETSRLLTVEGELFVQTDVKHRAEEYEQAVLAAGFRVDWLDHNPYGSVSGRESQAEVNGLPIHRFVARKGV